MQLIKKCEKASCILYYIAVLIHIAIMCEGNSSWENALRGRLLQIAFVLCLIKILMTFYEKWEWVAMAAFGAIGLLSYCLTGEKYFVYVAVLVFAAKSVDMKLVTLMIFDGMWISTIVIAVFSLLGYGGPVKLVQDFGRGMVETRYCFGFSHPNNLQGSLWYILALWVILYKEKNDWKHYTVATVLNVALFILTRSRTGLIVSELIILAGVVYTYWNRLIFEKKLTYILGYGVFAVVLVMSGVAASLDFTKGYGAVMRFLDKVTTGRMNLAFQGAYSGNWKAFMPSSIEGIVVDNGFAALPAEYGTVIAVVYIAFVCWTIFKTAQKKDGVAYMVVITCMFYTFMERSYVLNEAFMLSNLTVVVAMIILGVWGIEKKTDEQQKY